MTPTLSNLEPTMALETSTPKPKTMWRSWDKIPGEDLVERLRSLVMVYEAAPGMTFGNA